MDTNFSDLQIAQDVERLCNVINEALQKAEATLDEARKIDEMKELVNESKLLRVSVKEQKQEFELRGCLRSQSSS
jgi:hypothetical protein